MKKIIILFILAAVTFCAVSCKNFQVTDQNGPADTSIVTFSDKDIIDGTDNIAIASTQTTTNKKTVLKIKQFSGVEKVYTAKEDVDVRVDVSLYCGNLRVCVVSNGEIVMDIPYPDSTVVSLKKGDMIKVCGESAEFEITVKKKDN